MRVSQAEKDRSHTRIVDGAARLVRERGIEGTSVGDVMADAGLTHGGFYRHFATKDTLMGAALEAAFDQMLARLDPAAPAPGAPDANLPNAAQAAADFRAYYLSRGHAEHPGRGCPVAALGTEVARGSAGLKAAFGAGVRRMVAALARGRPDGGPAAEARAVRALAMMAGALMIARASDPATARAVLAACRADADDALATHTEANAHDTERHPLR